MKLSGWVCSCGEFLGWGVSEKWKYHNGSEHVAHWENEVTLAPFEERHPEIAQALNKVDTK